MPRFLSTNDVFAWTTEEKVTQWFNAEKLQVFRETLELTLPAPMVQNIIEFYAEIQHAYRISIHRGTNQAYRRGFKYMLLLMPGVTSEMLQAVTANADIHQHEHIVARVEVEEE